MRYSNANIKLIVYPFIILVILAGIIYASYTIGYPRVIQNIDDYKKIQKTENDMKIKAETLRQISQNVLDSADVSLIALPDKQEIVFMISNFKNVAQENNILIGKLSTINSLQEKDGIKGMSIKIDGIAERYSDIIEIVNKMKKTMPVVSIDKVVTSGSIDLNEISFSIELSTFWSSLPEEIPSITQPVNLLTSEQTELLASLSSYKRPDMVSLIPQEQSSRQNPFIQ